MQKRSSPKVELLVLSFLKYFRVARRAKYGRQRKISGEASHCVLDFRHGYFLFRL